MGKKIASWKEAPIVQDDTLEKPKDAWKSAPIVDEPVKKKAETGLENTFNAGKSSSPVLQQESPNPGTPSVTEAGSEKSGAESEPPIKPTGSRTVEEKYSGISKNDADLIRKNEKVSGWTGEGLSDDFFEKFGSKQKQKTGEIGGRQFDGLTPKTKLNPQEESKFQDWEGDKFIPPIKPTGSPTEPKINPAVANAFDVSRKGKEYQREKANELIQTKKQEFDQAYNSPFKDEDFAKGFQKTYNNTSHKTGQFPLTTALYKGAQSAITDLLGGELAAAAAGSMTANFDKYLVEKHSTFNPNDYWNPDKAYEQRKKEVVDKYIKEVGRDKYEQEKADFEKERTAQKEKLLAYSKHQEGEAEGKMSELPKSFGDIKDVPSALQYIGKNVGQTAGFMAPTITAGLVNPALGATVGLVLNSAIEKGGAYKEGLGLLEDNTKLSKKQLFETDADAALRNSSTQSGIINGMLEYVGELTTVGKFMPKNYIASSISKLIGNSKALGISIGTLTEGMTEWAQAKDTHYAAAIGAGKSPEEAAKYAMAQDDTEEFIAGITGGAGVSAVSHFTAPNKHSDLIDKTTEQVDKDFGKIETPNLDKAKDEGKGTQEAIRESVQSVEKTSEPTIEKGIVPSQGETVQEEIKQEVDNLKPKEDAISESKTGEILQRQPEETGEKLDSEIPIGTKVEFFSEKMREGIWDGKGMILDKNGNKWGSVGILNDKNGYIKPLTTIQNEEANQIRENETGSQTGSELQGKLSEGQKSGQEAQVSGIKKALVPEDRAIDPEKVTIEGMLDIGKKEIDEGKIVPDKLVEEINASPRALQPNEVAGLVYYKGQLDNQLLEAGKEVEKAETPEQKQLADTKFNLVNAQIDAYHAMALHTAKQQSLAFRLRQMMVDSEYNLVNEIEKYKKENKGVIPDEVLKKFQEYDTQLKEANKKILELEAKSNDKLVIQKLKDIAAFERKTKSKKKSAENRKKIEYAFEKVKAKVLAGKMTGTLNSGIPGLTVENIAKAIEVIKKAVLAGHDVIQAIKSGIEHLKSQGHKFDEKMFEDQFRALLDEHLPQESIDSKIHIPKNMLLGMVESGVNSIEELTKRSYELAKVKNPNITEREVRDAITNYGHTRSVSRDEIQGKLNGIKRIGRLISKIEDLKKGKLPTKNEGNSKVITDKEKALNTELKTLIKEHPEFKDQKLAEMKKNVQKSIAEYERRVKEGDFVTKKKTEIKPDKELSKMYKQKEHAIGEYESAHEKNRLQNRSTSEKLSDSLFSGINAPKALITSFDLSAPFRQGIYFITHPVQFAKGVGDMFRQMASQKAYDGYLAEVKNSDYWPVINKSKLSITSTSGKLSAHEELFMNRFTSFLPWVKISERAYSGFLNSLRLNVFMEGVNQLEKSGITFESNPEEYKRLAEHVNTGTGRSNLGTKGENAAKLLNTIFFSPRFFASRLKIVTTNNALIADPNTYKDNARGRVNRMILADQAKFFAFTSLMLGLLNKTAPDWEVEWNPLSSNFGKIKIGHNWYDITGGTAQITRYLAQTIMGKHKVNGHITEKDRIETLVSGATVKDRTPEKHHSSSLFYSKLSPGVGTAFGLMNNQYDLGGNKMTLPSVVMNYFVPLIINEAMQQKKIIDKHNAHVDWQIANGITPDKKRDYSEIGLPIGASFVGVSSTPAR